MLLESLLLAQSRPVIALAGALTLEKVVVVVVLCPPPHTHTLLYPHDSKRRGTNLTIFLLTVLQVLLRCRCLIHYHSIDGVAGALMLMTLCTVSSCVSEPMKVHTSWRVCLYGLGFVKISALCIIFPRHVFNREHR